MFCGCGKTRIITEIIKKEASNVSVIVFPSIALIDQFNQDYSHEFDNMHKMSVCSKDETCGGHTVKYTTDADKIIKFLHKKGSKLLTVTYQSYPNFVDIIKGQSIRINHLIYDEAHRTVGDKIQNIVYFDQEYDELVDKVLFATATHKNDNGVIMYDWDEPETAMCGKLIYHYTHIQGVEDGYLNDFDIMVYFYAGEAEKNLQDLICRSIFETKNSHVLTFHFRSETEHETRTNVLDFASDDNIKKFAKMYKQLGGKGKFTMKGLTAKTGNRIQVLKEFDATKDEDTYILASCRTIGEGVDTKNANMVVFIDPKQSYVDIIQNIGRVCRKTKGTTRKATVLIPCYVNLDKYKGLVSLEEKDKQIREDLQKTGDFNGILNVLSALRQSDPELYDACLMYPHRYTKFEVQRNLKKQGYSLDMIEDTDDLLMKLGVDLEEYDEEYDDMLDLVKMVSDTEERPLEIHTNSMEEPIIHYNEDAESRDIIRVYQDEDDMYLIRKTDKKVAKKITPPKKLKKSMNIHSNPDVQVYWDVVKELDMEKEIQAVYVEANVVVNNWMERYEELKKWVQENGRLPKSSSKSSIEQKLFKWISHRRQDYKRSKLSKDKIQLMEAIKEWSWDPIQDQFLKTYQELQKWVEENGRIPSESNNADVIEKKLNTWCQNRRKNYVKGILSQDQIQLLEQIPGFLWNPRNEHFFKMYENLQSWVKKYKRFPSTNAKDITEQLLGSWCSNKRNDYKLNKLTQDRIRLLEDVHGWSWDTKKNAFQMMYEKVKSWIEKNGRIPSQISQDDTEKQLGSWCSNKIQAYKKGKLSDTIIQLIEQIDGWNWDQFEDTFQKTFLEVKKWATENARLPNKRSKDNTEKQLGSWCSNKRRDYNNTKLSQDKIQLLEEIPGWSWEILQGQFQKTYQEVLQWVKENNRIPSENSKDAVENQKLLGKWCSHKRQDYKNQKLSQDKVQLLEQIPGWYWSKDTKTTTVTTTKSMEKPVIKAKTESKTSSSKPPPKSQLSELHKKYKTMNSANLHKHFQDNRQDWDNYHKIAEENEKTFPDGEIPYQRIIQELEKIQTKRTKVVADMGCGTARVYQALKKDKRFQFINMDHVAIDKHVKSVDIKNTDLEEGSVDVAILCLAMWGSNCEDYIKEAHRILDCHGVLFVIEPFKRWNQEDGTNRLEDMIVKHGFQVLDKEERKFMFYKVIKL
jgi:superfamily II DNA or RNA helicase